MSEGDIRKGEPEVYPTTHFFLRELNVIRDRRLEICPQGLNNTNLI